MIQDETFKSLVEPGSLNFVFGGNGFFGYSFVQSLTPTNQHTETPQPQVTPTDTVMWWSTYEMESCPDPKTIDPAAVLRDLHARLENWKDPIIQKLLTKVKIQTVYPLYTTPELPIWSRDGVVLIGDAAHTLSPTTGQGTCQALEDVECFSMLLAYGLREKYKAVSSARDTSEVTSDDFASFLAQKERETITRVMQTHMKLRKPRIHAIQEKAKRFDSNKKNIGIVSEFLMYLALFIMGKSRPQALYRTPYPGPFLSTLGD